MGTITISQIMTLDEGVAQQLTDHYRAAFPHDHHLLQAHDFIAAGLSSMDQLWLAADHTTEPIGALIFRLAGDEAEIITLFIASRLQRQGIASALLGALLAQAQIEQVFLEVAEDNLAAQMLYRRLGFHNIGRRVGYYRRKTITIDAITMRFLRSMPEK